MAKSTRYFSKVIDGETVTQAADTEEDKVRFVYEGWRDITDEVATAREVAKTAAGKDTAKGGKTDPKAQA